MLLFSPGIVNLPVIDRDEAHFAQASRQMLQSGNYFQIRFQEGTRFQKPPGINWLQAFSVKLFSDKDSTAIWPYRIPSVLSALLSVLLTYYFSRRFLSARVAKLASALLASTLLLVVETHMAVIDTALLSAVVVMQGALWVVYREGISHKKAHWGWALCFWLAMAYGMVLKGVTPLVGFLSIIALCCLEKRVDWLKGLHPFKGLLLFISLSLSWLLLLNTAENANYLMQMLNKDLLPKLKGGHESHGKPPLFHLVILPLTFWPASFFLWQAAVYAYLHRHEKIVRFLLCWIIPTWLFFEIMPTKLPQYVLPTFPAIALLCSLAIAKETKDALPGKWLRFLQILWGLLSLGLATSILSLPYLLMQQFTFVSLFIFAGMVILTVITVYFAWFGFYRHASILVLLMALFTYPPLFFSLLPQLKPLWLTTNLAQLIDKNKLSEKKPLLVVDFGEPSLVFNLNTFLVKFSNSTTAEQIIKTDPSRVALVEPLTYNAWKGDGLEMVILARTHGFNYSKGRWVELFIVEGEK